MAKPRIRVVLVNRIYPPSAGITGESAAELVGFLCSKGLEVLVVHIDAPYLGGVEQASIPGKVHKINTFYNGRNKRVRLLANLYEGLMLVRKARSLKPDVIISMTDPPLVNFWCALLLKRFWWILWSMDLYPEAFISGNLVSRKNLFYRLIDRVVRSNPPKYLIALGEYQREYLLGKYKKSIDTVLLPCGIYSNGIRSEFTKPSWCRNDKITLGYCGNLGEAHSRDFLFSVIDRFPRTKYQLVLSLYGSRATEILRYVQGKQGIILVPNVARQELQFIDIHLASLVKEWVNVSVPSKTVSSVCAGSTFLYFGPEASDNWDLLRNAGWLVDGPDINTWIDRFFDELTLEEVSIKKKIASSRAIELNSMKKEAFESIYRRVSLLNAHAGTSNTYDERIHN
ncbi:MAG: hypothetical protein EOO43_08345 [Flavobacterium sp.]|nr:MAG: hypothetical protein EOO43_08345 [Flavobacterium sp.]